jgi:hypothetical protein
MLKVGQARREEEGVRKCMSRQHSYPPSPIPPLLCVPSASLRALFRFLPWFDLPPPPFPLPLPCFALLPPVSVISWVESPNMSSSSSRVHTGHVRERERVSARMTPNWSQSQGADETWGTLKWHSSLQQTCATLFASHCECPWFLGIKGRVQEKREQRVTTQPSRFFTHPTRHPHPTLRHLTLRGLPTVPARLRYQKMASARQDNVLPPDPPQAADDEVRTLGEYKEGGRRWRGERVWDEEKNANIKHILCMPPLPPHPPLARTQNRGVYCNAGRRS